MFNKLLSNLPFNPSLIQQVSFYAKRLQKEAAIRRLGFAFVALAMILQIFATIAPAQASLQCDPSNNDIIQCGFRTKDEAVNHCRRNDQGLATILNYYGVSCDAVAAAGTQTVNSRAYDNRLRSVGRKAFGKPGETSVSIPGAGTFFWRPLSSWGNFNSKMLTMRTNDNQMVMMMFECGNLVTLDDFRVPRPEPEANLKIAKINQPTGDVKPGSTINYTLAFTNKGGTAAFFSVNDVLPNEVSYVSSQYANWNFENKGTTLKWYNTTPYATFGNTDAFGTPGFITVQVRVKDNVPSGTTICNRAYLQDVNLTTKQPRNWNEAVVCNIVRVTCPAGEVLGSNGVTCEPVKAPDARCVSLLVTKQISRTEYEFTTTAETVDGAKITGYTYNFGEGSPVTKTSSSLKNTVTHNFSTAKTYDVSVVVKSSVANKPALTCRTSVNVPKETSSMLSRSKRAANLTKNISDANNTTASGGDVIQYTVTTTNLGDGDAKNITLAPEDLSDVLEYADLDLASLDGGTFDAQNKSLSWNAKTDIDAGKSVSKTFKVTVKNPIPATPRPDVLGNKSSFDLNMNNVYGNEINIKLPGNVIKITETTTTNLPNTGPGETLLVTFLITGAVAYFFARTRLMAKELELVKVDYTHGGA